MTDSADRLLLAALPLILLAALALAELRWHARPATRGRRWGLNLGLGLLNGLLVRLAVAIGPVAVAAWADASAFGLFHHMPIPGWLAGGLAIVLLDLAVYAQHRLFHAVPWLWRWHRLHHADVAMDVTTGVRFHPVEIALSFVWKSAVVATLGAPVWAVVAFELLLTAASLWEHANLALPARLDARLRRLIVTPAMHVTHHSDGPRDTEHNFGFFLSVWDRACGTYRATPLGARLGLR